MDVSFAYGAVVGHTLLALLPGINYQLAGESLGNLTYAYDQDGRRIQMGGSWARTGMPNPTISTAVYNAANELTNWNGATLTYDADGNMTSDGTNTYKWNERNQLDSITGNFTAGFEYDPFGRRLGKTINGTTTDFLYDGANPIQELSGTTVTANLLTGLGIDEYLTRTDATGTSDFLTDALGSTIGLADPTGTVQTQYTYDPYGGTTMQGSASVNSYEFTGRENDGDGLYYYRARYYDPMLSRFVSQDPTGFSGGINLYAYTGCSPVNGTDRDGTGVVGCVEAVKELVAASGNLARRTAEITEHGGCPDPGHMKALRQAIRRLEKAREKVRKYCPNFPGAAAAVAAAARAFQDAGEYAPDLVQGLLSIIEGIEGLGSAGGAVPIPVY